jgi:hypothetical protein
MTFGEAIVAMEFGQRVTRQAWINSGGIFLYLVPEGQYPARTDVAKAEWGEDALVPYQPYVAMKTRKGSVVPWTPSQTDMLAKDWEAQ